MDVIIEVPIHSKIKYEYDEKNKCFRVDRFLHNTNSFPWNYGFIPNTLSPDGDPLDIFVICEHKVFPGTRIKVTILGGIETNDEKGLDHKLISVPVNDPQFKDITSIKQLPDAYLNKLKYFLTHYKDGEDGKFINVSENFYDFQDALDLIKKYTCDN